MIAFHPARRLHLAHRRAHTYDATPVPLDISDRSIARLCATVWYVCVHHVIHAADDAQGAHLDLYVSNHTNRNRRRRRCGKAKDNHLRTSTRAYTLRAPTHTKNKCSDRRLLHMHALMYARSYVSIVILGAWQQGPWHRVPRQTQYNELVHWRPMHNNTKRIVLLCSVPFHLTPLNATRARAFRPNTCPPVKYEFARSLARACVL